MNTHTQTHNTFDAHEVLHELAHYLPSQTPIKDFIHHNSLHAFQDMKFFDAIFKASKIFGYQATLQLADYRTMYEQGRISPEVLNRLILDKKGVAQLANWQQKLLSQPYNVESDARIGTLRQNWKKHYKIDMDTMVHPTLFRILCSYLDQGIAIWDFPTNGKGLIAGLKTLEKNSFTSFFKTKTARKLLLSDDCTVESLLKMVVGNPSYYKQYLYDQQFAHRGWSGMAATLEHSPDTLLSPKKITLEEVVLLDLLLEIDNLTHKFGAGNWQPLAQYLTEPPMELLDSVPPTELQEVYELWQKAFEWSYYDQVLSGISALKDKKSRELPQKEAHQKSFQAIFCIDERECSLRRHVEQLDTECETLGMPGFFGVEFYFQAENAKFYDKMAPAPVTPRFLIKEQNNNKSRPQEAFYNSKAHTLLGGYLASFTFGYWAIGKLIRNLYAPKMTPAISNAFAHMHKYSSLSIENKDVNDQENGLQIGFTTTEMADRVEGALRNIGLIKNFAPLIYLVSHGASTANNPHHGAYDCGACSGRPGSVNSKVMAFMANHPKVREILVQRGITIPDSTQFLGAMHDTAADEMQFYELDALSSINQEAHKNNEITFENALNWNAKERSRRFASIDTKGSLVKVRQKIKERSVSFFEPRPELGHGTNALCIIGNRSFTKGLFLDRRAFMNSYDYKTDPEGKLLLGVMRPIGPVCGGINLEYYFSRVDNYKLGAGTKLSHNVMGLIGVANSSDGDLRPGLPIQMVEVHDPVRLMVIVEHSPEIVLKAINTQADTYQWFQNEWVHLVAACPVTNKYFYFKNEQFQEYTPGFVEIQNKESMIDLIESAKLMKSNKIVDSTKENLPIHILQ